MQFWTLDIKCLPYCAQWSRNVRIVIEIDLNERSCKDMRRNENNRNHFKKKKIVPEKYHKIPQNKNVGSHITNIHWSTWIKISDARLTWHKISTIWKVHGKLNILHTTVWESHPFNPAAHLRTFGLVSVFPCFFQRSTPIDG